MRRESIAMFSSYLDWIAQSEAPDPTPTEPEPEPDCHTEPQNARAPTDSDHLRYSIAKTSPYPATTAVSIINNYGAVDFFPSLRSFLSSQSLLPPDFDSIKVPFPAFKQFTINIPPIRHASSHQTNDVIRATIARKQSNNRQKEKPPLSNTVLARKGPPTNNETRQVQTLDGMYSTRS